MEHDTLLQAPPDALEQVRALCEQAERALEQASSPVRKLRLHCLREKSSALLDALAPSEGQEAQASVR